MDPRACTSLWSVPTSHFQLELNFLDNTSTPVAQTDASDYGIVGIAILAWHFRVPSWTGPSAIFSSSTGEGMLEHLQRRETIYNGRSIRGMCVLLLLLLLLLSKLSVSNTWTPLMASVAPFVDVLLTPIKTGENSKSCWPIKLLTYYYYIFTR